VSAVGADGAGGARVLDVDRHPATRWINYGVKAALFVSFAVAIGLAPDSVEGKAMGFQAPLFLASAVLVPIIARMRGWSPHPHTAEALLAAPFLVDTLGNLSGIYDDFRRRTTSSTPSTGSSSSVHSTPSTGGLLGSIIGVIWLGPRR